MKSIVVNFDLYGDIERLKTTYEEQLSYCKHMVNKLKENSYKSDNSEEIMNYALEINYLKTSLKKLEKLQ